MQKNTKFLQSDINIPKDHDSNFPNLRMRGENAKGKVHNILHNNQDIS